MASLKVEKPIGQQVKKEPTKPSDTTPKAPASKIAAAPIKVEQKPREPRKKVTLIPIYWPDHPP